MHQISADHHTKQYGSKEDLLILKYNLDIKVQKQYQYMCQDGTNTLCWYFPTYYRDYLAPPESGRNQINFWFIVYLYEQLWDYGNQQLWQLDQLPHSHNQIFFAHLLTKECLQACSQPNSIDRYFTKLHTVGLPFSLVSLLLVVTIPLPFSFSDWRGDWHSS